MTIAELITIIIGVSSLVTALSVIYAKFIKPVKKVVKQVEENTKQIKIFEDKITKIKVDRADDDLHSVEVRAVLFESLLAIHDGLEQLGCNHGVTENKKKLIKFMSQQVGSRGKK